MYDSNIIVWEKWVDPLDFDDTDDQVGAEPEFIDEDADRSSAPKFEIKKIRAIATPMGIIPIGNQVSDSNLFNFWVGHSNFNITAKVAEIIEQSEGVESLDIFTRYRFRISVGKAFDDSSVMRNINTKVYAELDHAKQ